jgi:hypothetical protein
MEIIRLKKTIISVYRREGRRQEEKGWIDMNLSLHMLYNDFRVKAKEQW